MSALPRNRIPEWMDQPSIPVPDHHQALTSLAAINRLSRTAGLFLPHILRLAQETGRREFTLLDVACGGADVPIRLAHLAGQQGIRLHLLLADRNETALRFAAAKQAPTAPATFALDAFSSQLPEADILTNSLFLHHLDSAQLSPALSHFSSLARRLLLISDLRRSRLGLGIALATCNLISRSALVHHDGPASVRAAFTLAEMRQAAQESFGRQSNAFTLRPVWPWRMLLTWRRK